MRAVAIKGGVAKSWGVFHGCGYSPGHSSLSLKATFTREILSSRTRDILSSRIVK